MRHYFLGFLFFLVAGCGADDQLYGRFDLNFGTSNICVPRTERLKFSNSTAEEVVIGGASIAPGTDPLKNFVLEGVTVGEVEIPSVAGSLSEIRVPPGADYIFTLTYTPKTAGEEHDALLDIAYQSPQMGVYQVALSGTPEGDSAGGCVNLSEGSEVSFDGEVALTVTRLVAATSKLDAPISSDDGERVFEPTDLTLILNLKEAEATLPPIAEGIFILPKPKKEVPTLGPRVKQDTMITTVAEASGQYDSAVGSITLEDVSVKMDADFNTTVVVTLTTDEVSLEALGVMPNSNALQSSFGNDHYDSVGKKIFGSRIDEEGNITLVGTTKIVDSTLDPGADGIFNGMKGTTMALLIEGKISIKVSSE
ncbi:MAG: hypothetical protein HYT76_07115 [Deltaproteobacteria bacterium]|nr:hypothetical protein [Deltaproteobacteria bacterium]